MSIQVGIYDNLVKPHNRVFNNERIQLYSDVQSNLLELASSCNQTGIVMDRIQISSSNMNSNFVISSFIYGSNDDTLFSVSKNSSIINTSNCIFGGNMTVTGRIVTNSPTTTDDLSCSNIVISCDPTNPTPFFVHSGASNLITLNTASNTVLIEPNVGIGTTIVKYMLQTQGSMYTTEGMYTSYLRSNASSPNIRVYGNLNILGALAVTEPFSLGNVNLSVAGINIVNNQYTLYPAVSAKQHTGASPLAIISALNDNGTSNVMFGISSSGRTYIGTDVANLSYMSNIEYSSNSSNAMFNIHLPFSNSNDNLLRATSYSSSNALTISNDAYLGIGTTTILHQLHIHTDSNVILENPLTSNLASIGIYQDNIQSKPIFAGYSNSIPVVSISGTGDVSVGTNSKIYLRPDGTVSASNIQTSNISLYGTLTSFNNGIASISNVLITQSPSISVKGLTSTSNITTPYINIASNTTVNDIYISGDLSGPNVTLFVGVNDATYFNPSATGLDSVSHFKTSNVIMSVNSNYSAEIAGAIAGNSNGILHVRTYPSINGVISPGVSIYGSSNSSALVTAYRPYYQLQRIGASTYNIGINASDELIIGKLNSSLASSAYTLSQLTVSNDTVTIGSVEYGNTRLYTKVASPVLVSSTNVSSLSSGFEVIGSSYARSTGSKIMIHASDDTGYVGIGNLAPKCQLDVTGNTIISGNVGIGTITPRFALDVIGNAYISSNIGIGTSTVNGYILNVGGDINVEGNIYKSGNPFISSQWTTTGSNIYYTTGNVGIGTSISRYTLDIPGTLNATNFVGNASGMSNITSQLMWVTGGGMRVVNQKLVVDGALFVHGNIYGGCNTTVFTGGSTLPNVITRNVVANSNIVNGSITLDKLYPSACNFQWLSIPGGGLRTSQKVVIDHDIIVGGNIYNASNVNLDTMYSGGTIIGCNIGIGVINTSNLANASVTIPKIDFTSNLPIYFSGNVGIGTTTAVSPYHKFEVHGNFATYGLTGRWKMFPRDNGGIVFQLATSVVGMDGGLYHAGDNTYGQAGTYTTINITGSLARAAIPYTETIKMFCVNGGAKLVLTESNKLYSFGYNGYGQLGLGDTTNRSVPTLISLPTSDTIVDIQLSCTDAGGNAVTQTDGGFLTSTGKLYLWGYNVHGEVANGTTTSPVTSPYQSTFQPVWKGFLLGVYANFAWTLDTGTLYATGYNNLGQLGVGDTVNRSSWTACLDNGSVPLMNVIKVRTNSSWSGGSTVTTYALTSENGGQLYATGYNGYGQCGTSNTTNQNTFYKIPTMTNVIDFAIGSGAQYNGVFAVKNDNTLWVFGRNIDGQFGTPSIGTDTNQLMPTQVLTADVNSNVLRVYPVGLPDYGGMFLQTTDSKWYFAGHSYYGAGLADNTVYNTWTQILVPEPIVDIRSFRSYWTGTGANANSHTTFMLGQSGKLWGFGNNNYNQHGLRNTTTDSSMYSGIHPVYASYGG
ncbi:regulator of chromosome condensation (RCC1) repeat protein [Dishui Lake large algae virus 1]|nr:regulator of chromosome condensation (RCC1) repeat protein [Dishui Lake large algae virus 1]